MSNVALSKPIDEPITNPTSATDGQVSVYSANDGFAEFSWPYTLTVDLGEPFKLFCIRVLLWDGLGNGNKQRDSRIYKYRLLTSVDHLSWKVIYDSFNDGGNGWQVFSFPEALEARYVRVHGIWNSANDKFQIVQLEAHDNVPPDLNAEIVLQRTVLSDSIETEIGDGMPLQARVGRVINRIERLVEDNDFLKPEPFRQLISELRNQVSDVASLERGMDSIRREIITPVRHQLDQSGRLSFWGLWVGLIGGILAILSLTFSLWQGLRYSNNLTQPDKRTEVLSTVQPTRPVNVSDLENHDNAPKAFMIERRQPPSGTGFFTRQDDKWFQEYPGPDHRKIQLSLSGRIILKGCVGSLLYRNDESGLSFEYFVPDKGCSVMKVLLRTGKSEWGVLGDMDNVQ